MFQRKLLSVMRWVFTRVGLLYLAIFVVTIPMVNITAVSDRIKVRRLNDTRPEMSSLIRFNEGSILADKVMWPSYKKYFSLVVKYMPDEKISRMFLGFCEYYSGDPHHMALAHIERAANEPPLVYWGAYNAGILAFKQGYLAKAILFLERALKLPTEIAVQGIMSSVIYRQLMSSPAFKAVIPNEIDASRENIYLFLSAAYYYINDHERSMNAALYALYKIKPRDPEPFYFYAGASSLAMGQKQESLFFLNQCIKMQSSNPFVYRYVAEILRSTGNEEDARKMIQVWQSLKDKDPAGFPYSDRIRLRIF